MLIFAKEKKESLKNPLCLFNIAKLQFDYVIKKGTAYTDNDAKILHVALKHLEQIRATFAQSEIPYKYYSINELELLTAKIYTVLNTIPNQDVDWKKPLHYITQAMTLLKYKSNTDEETIKLDFLRFLIKQGCFENMLEFLHSFGKKENNYIKKSIHDSDALTALTFCFNPLTIPLVLPYFLGALATATTNGIIDAKSRIQLSPEAQLQLFCHLSTISKKDEHTKKTILENIYKSYTSPDRTFFKQSKASVKLSALLNDSTLTTSQKWEYIVDYATDMSKNNGKTLLHAINNVLIQELGVKQIPTQGNSGHTSENKEVDGFYLI